MATIPCVLCANSDTQLKLIDDTRTQTGRRFYSCRNCGLIFVHPSDRLVREDEFERYEMHENDPEDPNYRKFLSKLFNPMNMRIPENSFGLDFGSGPGPTLNLMFEEAGHSVKIFDSFYHRDNSVFDEQYDFITTSETAEHLFDPLTEFDRLWNCLNPGGYLGVMTSQVPKTEKFSNWHYKNDDTHVSFYSEETFRWMAERWEAELEIINDSVVIFKKK